MTEHQDKPLIAVSQVTIGGTTVQAVDARDLHAFLGVGRDFTNWVKAQIERARLVADRDYLLTQKGEQLPSGTKWRTEYWLALDAAKHVAMMTGTERGFEVREYFIECEKRLRDGGPPRQGTVDPVPQPLAQDPAWAAWLALPVEERRQRNRDALLYRMAAGVPGLRLAMWNQGYPIPPRYMLGSAAQHELEVQGFHPTAISVHINQGTH